MESTIQLHTIFFMGLHRISLFYSCGDVSYREICLCVVNDSLQIYVSYSKNFLVFHPSCFEGFPKVYLVSHGWLFYMVYLWRWFIWLNYEDDLCGWYICEIYMWLIYLWYSHVADIFICGWFMRHICAEIDW